MCRRWAKHVQNLLLSRKFSAALLAGIREHHPMAANKSPVFLRALNTFSTLLSTVKNKHFYLLHGWLSPLSTGPIIRTSK